MKRGFEKKPWDNFLLRIDGLEDNIYIHLEVNKKRYILGFFFCKKTIRMIRSAFFYIVNLVK